MKVVALAGGVGGAKLAHGLAQVLAPEDLTIIVNTGDDFEHYGLKICPDLDTVCYTLAGLANAQTGWGRTGESWQAIRNASRLGGPDWFNLGDADLGTHLERTRRLRLGQSLSEITRDFCAAWGIGPRIIPMSDETVSTWVETRADGILPFQEYFVHRQCAPHVTGFRFEGCREAKPAPGIMQAMDAADLIVICPSNPWVSIGPIFSVAPLRDWVSQKYVLAVSPIIGGKAIKGPAAKMYQELGITPSALAVAQQFGDILDAFVLDEIDSEQAAHVQGLGIHPIVLNTVMQTTEDRRALAEKIIHFRETIL